MSRIMEYLHNLVWPDTRSPDEKYDEIMEKIDALFGDTECDKQQSEETSYMPNAEFFRYEGKITHLYNTGDGRIDDQYPFYGGAVGSLKLKVGDNVVCMARKISDENPVEIYKIQGKWLDEWGEKGETADTFNPIAISTRCEWIGGCILAKVNGEILVDILRLNKKILISINDFGCTFNPRVGDEINIQFEYGVDGNDTVNDILGFYAIRPIRSKTLTGKITKFKKKLSYGIVGNEFLFYMDVLQHSDNRNNMPDKDDFVDIEVISGVYSIDTEPTLHWRCIRLVKNIQNSRPIVKHDLFALNSGDGSDDETNFDSTCGIQITSNEELQVSLQNTNDKKIIELIVCNLTDRSREIAQVKFEHEIMSSQIRCPDLYRVIKIQPNGKHKYSLQIIGKICGPTEIKIMLTIDKQYKIRRCITVHVSRYEDEDTGAVRLARSAAYTKNIYDRKADVLPGIRPVNAPRFIENRLKYFSVPKKIFDAVLSSNTYAALDMLVPTIAETLCHHGADNYAEYFHNLLYFEEIYLRHEFCRYDQERGHFIRDREYLAYEMKDNIFECRPSIVVGDMIRAETIIKRNFNEKATQYLGYVHKITRKRLLLKFDEEFQSTYNGEDYKLIFEFSRSKLNRLHNGVHRVGERLARDTPEIMFPTKIVVQKHLQVKIDLIDGDLQTTYPVKKWGWNNPKLNIIQKEAVCNVLRGEARSIPYVIFGPPGTGKTSTLIETILQLVRKNDANIIVATPSNSSANLITKLLIDSKHLECGEFVRIVSINSLERETIPEEIHRFCLTANIAAPGSRADEQHSSSTGIKYQCDSRVLSTYRILVSTCSTFGSLLYMKFPKNHFSHVIIDEAGQCTEPEATIPISLLDKYGQIILAGDPKQLGPVVLSQLAKTRGLDKSLLCRLMDRLPYMENVMSDGFDRRTVTKLLHNYRSLPSILNVYSDLFYDGQLIPNISESDSKEFSLLQRMQTNSFFQQKHDKNYGVYFYGVRGNEERTRDSTSWRNPQETWKVVMIITKLFSLGFTENDIGVITPYSLQVKDLRLLCEHQFENRSIKIGSVEEFQGQERNIIIISTVRSKSKNMLNDEKYGLGFIKNSRRLNVAISRARAALIIIGNPNVLSVDSYWKSIIDDCAKNGTYSGTNSQQLNKSPH